MSSRDIAEITGKQHQHVKRDIENMVSQLGEAASKFGHIYTDSMNREQTEFALDYDHTICLVAGYDAEVRTG